MASGQELESTTLFFERSPFGHCDAVVETDGRTIYFYLSWPDEARVAPCWVANLQPAPLTFDRRELEANLPPLLPKPFLRKISSEEQIVVAGGGPEDWSVVWDPAGHGAMLIWREHLVAVIPPWSGQEGVHGYARECAVENLVCQPLPPSETWQNWLSSARDYWQSWMNDRYFAEYQQAYLTKLQELHPQTVSYFSIDGGKFPPRAIASLQLAGSTEENLGREQSGFSGWNRWRRQSGQLLTTVGLGLCPQPTGNWTVVADQRQFRIELAIFFSEPLTDSERDEFLRQLGGLANIPWKRNTCFRPGDTCELRWRGQLHTCRIESLGTLDLGVTVQPMVLVPV